MEEYAWNSGQVINNDKSLLFLDKYAIPWQANIQRELGINVGSLPFNYLGVPIFLSHSKSDYFLPIADKVKGKLSSWKGSQLSQAGRL